MYLVIATTVGMFTIKVFNKGFYLASLSFAFVRVHDPKCSFTFRVIHGYKVSVQMNIDASEMVSYEMVSSD